MNETVTVTLYATYSGETFASAPVEYSAATYCYNMLDRCTTNSYAKLRTLLVDLLNYGAASQQYVNYNTDQLVNANLTDEQKVWGTSADRELTSIMNKAHTEIANPSVQWMGVGLLRDENVTMRYRIDAESVEGLRVVFTGDDFKTVTLSTFEAAQDGGYYVCFDALHAAQMSEEVYATVYLGNTPVSNTVLYSIESMLIPSRMTAMPN